MKHTIQRMEIFGVDMPLAGNFTSAGITKNVTKCVVIRLTASSGAIGISRAAAFISSTGAEGAAGVISTVVATGSGSCWATGAAAMPAGAMAAVPGVGIEEVSADAVNVAVAGVRGVPASDSAPGVDGEIRFVAVVDDADATLRVTSVGVSPAVDGEGIEGRRPFDASSSIAEAARVFRNPAA